MDIPLVYRLSCQWHCRVATCGRDNRWKHLNGKPASRLDLPRLLSPEGSLKTTTLIGHRCMCSNAFSRVILITRVAWLYSFNLYENFCVLHQQYSQFINTTIAKFFLLVVTETRIHLFPFRTQKLSLSSPMVLLGWLGGRVGHCQLFSWASRFFLEALFALT